MIDRRLTCLASALFAICLVSGCDESLVIVSPSPDTQTAANASGDPQQASAKVPDAAKPRATSDQGTNNALSDQIAQNALNEFQVSATGLGVYFEPEANGIRVTYVATDSSAADAGIRVDDIITEVDGSRLEGVDSPTVSAQLGGELGKKKTLTLGDGRSCRVTITDFTLQDLGAVRSYDEETFAEPDLEGLHSKLHPVAQLIVDKKYRAAGQVLKTLAASESTNGSYYLIRSILTAAEHGMLTSDSRNVEQGSDTSLTDRVLEDVKLAVELDENLRDTAAELLCWLATRVVVDAAEQQTALTLVEADDYFRWQSEPPRWFRAPGDWIKLFRKGQELNERKATRYLAGMVFACERYRNAGDPASACFLQDVIAYQYSTADPNNQQMAMEQNRRISRAALRFLIEVVKQDPEQALYVSAVFNGRCGDHRNTMLQHDLPELETLLELLHRADPRAEAHAIRYFTRHNPPRFDRLKTPLGAYLYHMEAFFQDDYEGFQASSGKSVLEELSNLQEWAEQLEENPFAQQMLAMQMVTCGLLPEFAEEAAGRKPLVMHDQQEVEFHLITMKLDNVRFHQDVTMLVPMSARQQFQTVVQMMESAGHEQGSSDELQTALQAGRGDELVIGVVRRTGDEKYQVLTSAALKLVQQLSEVG